MKANNKCIQLSKSIIIDTIDYIIIIYIIDYINEFIIINKYNNCIPLYDLFSIFF